MNLDDNSNYHAFNENWIKPDERHISAETIFF